MTPVHFADAPSAVPILFLLQMASFLFHLQLFLTLSLSLFCRAGQPVCQADSHRGKDTLLTVPWLHSLSPVAFPRYFVPQVTCEPNCTINTWIWPKPFALLPKPRGTPADPAPGCQHLTKYTQSKWSFQTTVLCSFSSSQCHQERFYPQEGH